MIKGALVGGLLAARTEVLSQTGNPTPGIPSWLLKQGNPAPDPNRPLSQSDRDLLTDLFPFQTGVYSIVLAKGTNQQPTALGLPHVHSGFVEKMVPANDATQNWNFERTNGPDSKSTYISIQNSNLYIRADEEGGEGAVLALGPEKFLWILENAADKVGELGNFTIKMASHPELVIDYAPDLDFLFKMTIRRPHGAEGSQLQIWTLNQIS